MKMIQIVMLIVVSIFASQTMFAQHGKVNRQTIYVAGDAAFTFQKQNAYRAKLFEKNGKCIADVTYYDNDTPGDIDDDFIRIHFIEEKIVVEDSIYVGNWRYIMKKIISNGMFDTDGSLNMAKIKWLRDCNRDLLG